MCAWLLAGAHVRYIWRARGSLHVILAWGYRAVATCNTGVFGGRCRTWEASAGFDFPGQALGVALSVVESRDVRALNDEFKANI